MLLVGWSLVFGLAYQIQSPDVRLIEPHHTHFALERSHELSPVIGTRVELTDRWSIIGLLKQTPSETLLGEDGRRQFERDSGLEVLLLGDFKF